MEALGHFRSGINNGKLFFFFDQEGNVWNTYNYEKEIFEIIDYVPKLTQNFAWYWNQENFPSNGKGPLRKFTKQILGWSLFSGKGKLSQTEPGVRIS